MFSGRFKLLLAFYSLTGWLFWPLLYVYYALRAATDGKYKTSRRFRMGLSRARFIPHNERIWIHALSVGETLSAVPFVEALKRLAPQAEIVFSSSTETGHDIARKHLGHWVSRFFFMPHDFLPLMEATIRAVHPRMFVLVETDLWPHLALALRKSGIPSVILNGRVSDKSFQRLMRLRRFTAPLYEPFQWIFVQSEQDRQRFAALTGHKEKILACGNIKFDASLREISPADGRALRRTAGIDLNRGTWIAGSTHPGEEKILFTVHCSLREIHPDLLLVVAPRDIGRASELVAMARGQGLSAGRRSLGQEAHGHSVYVLDTLGELKRFYALAHAAFIGGSLVPLGGHNPLEALAQSIPTLWGPHLSNFREIERALLVEGCGFLVADGDELRNRLGEMIGNDVLREQIRLRLATFKDRHAGASERIARMVLAHPAAFFSTAMNEKG